MGQIVFSDNDIILKLSEYNLLLAACNIVDVTPSEVMVLHSSKHYFLRMRDKVAKGRTDKYSDAGLNRAIKFVESAHRVVEYPDLDWFAELDDIDIGEAQLATWVADIGEGSLLLSGDKKFFKALAVHNGTAQIFQSLYGRVICFEELIKALIFHSGFESLRHAIAAAPQCDSALNLVFGSHFDLPEVQVLEGLNSMIRDISRIVGDGWLKHL